MRLSASNIGWTEKQDNEIYLLLKEYQFEGLEIAPTRIFQEAPYDRLEEAKNWINTLRQEYGFVVPSMQSIWFGRQEKVFGSEEERQVLVDYTKKAIEFAAVIGCRNLVFGCPRNRVIPDGMTSEPAIRFFREIGDYAYAKGTVIGMEANPPIYNTNYINDTVSALQLIQEVGSKGFLLNLDVGTMIENGESVEELQGMVPYINHVHISEPGLKPIEERTLHISLRNLLEKENYKGFLSIEMGKTEEVQKLESAFAYVREVFK